MGGERRREKSLRIGVHHANAVVWGPVYRTRLLVKVEEHVRAVGDAEPARVDGHARSLERVDLLEHPGEVHDDAVAHDAFALFVEDARGDEMERVLLAVVVVDGVARVRAALASRDDVVLLSSVEVAGEDGWGRRGRGGREFGFGFGFEFERREGPRGAKKNETRAAAAITTVDPLGLGFRRGRARVAIAGRRRVARETRDRSSPGNAERTRARRRG